MIWTKAFWMDAGERAAKTFAQAFVAAFGVGSTILTVDWVAIAATAGTAALLSVGTSIITVSGTSSGKHAR